MLRLPRQLVSSLLRRWLASASGLYVGLGRLDDNFRGRRDLLRIQVQEGLIIDVFWKSRQHGKGPSLSLFVCGDEFARFDCLGPGEGHFHLALFTPAPVAEYRIWFHESSAREQIKRSVFEIKMNLPYYLERAANPRIRIFKLDREKLREALSPTEARMREYLLEVPELKDLP